MTIGYFKFTQKKFATQMLAQGIIAIGSLSYYRDSFEEPKLREARIGDRLEGATEATHDPISTSQPSSAEIETLRKMGVKISNVRDLRASGNRSVLIYPNRYIYCVSVGEIDVLRPRFKAKDTDGSFEACIRLLDIKRFRDGLMRGRLTETGIAVSDLFSEINSGDVSYAVRSFNVSHEDRGPPDPFVKEPDFSWQTEHRFVLTPKGEVSGKLLIIEAKEIMSCIEAV